MASSSDAVRNFVYDVHRHNLRQGWQIVQQLEQKQLDSWERIHAAFRVTDPNDGTWGTSDEKSVASFSLACPLLGDELARQLAAQAALFMRSSQPQPLQRGNSGRFGSLRDRIDRLYLRERQPSNARAPAARPLNFSRGSSYFQAGKVAKTAKLVPLLEAVQHPGFSVGAD